MLSTDNGTIEKMLKSLDFEKVKTFYDLGSGNGKVVEQVSRFSPETCCVAVERNVAAISYAKLRNFFLKQKVIFIGKSFFDVSLNNADVVYVYLFPEIMDLLEIKFSSELKSGSVVIANSFPLKRKNPQKIIPGNAGKLGTLYVYQY